MAAPLIGSLLAPKDPLKPIDPLTGPSTSNAPLPPIGSTTAEAQTMTSAPAVSRDMTAVTRSVDKPTETVQGQLGSMLESGSPYLERARAGSVQTANRRGLINSSIAAGAGEAAAIDAAAPIAQADANIYNQAAGQNLQYRNQAESQNAQVGTQVNMQNATEANRASAQNAQLGSQISQSNAENNLKLVLSQADNNTKTSLANIEADYKVLMQSNASAADLYKMGQQNISTILMNKDLDAPAKNAAINQQLQLMRNGMSMVGGMAGLSFTDVNGNKVGLDGLLDFSESGIAVPVESQALIAARNAVSAAKEKLAAAHAGGSTRRKNAAMQQSAREELARATTAYEQLAAAEASGSNKA